MPPGSGMDGWIRLIVGFQPLMVISQTASCWCVCLCFPTFLHSGQSHFQVVPLNCTYCHSQLSHQHILDHSSSNLGLASQFFCTWSVEFLYGIRNVMWTWPWIKLAKKFGKYSFLNELFRSCAHVFHIDALCWILSMCTALVVHVTKSPYSISQDMNLGLDSIHVLVIFLQIQRSRVFCQTGSVRMSIVLHSSLAGTVPQHSHSTMASGVATKCVNFGLINKMQCIQWLSTRLSWDACISSSYASRAIFS